MRNLNWGTKGLRDLPNTVGGGEGWTRIQAFGSSSHQTMVLLTQALGGEQLRLALSRSSLPDSERHTCELSTVRSTTLGVPLSDEIAMCPTVSLISVLITEQPSLTQILLTKQPHIPGIVLRDRT